MSSDVSVIVLTPDDLDIKGTQRMISDIYDAFEKKTFILINKAFPERTSLDAESLKGMSRQIENALNKPVIGEIPCFCDILEASRSFIFALNKPEHPFARNLEAIAQKLSQTLTT